MRSCFFIWRASFSLDNSENLSYKYSVNDVEAFLKGILDAGAVPATSTTDTSSSKKVVGHDGGVRRNAGANPVDVSMMGVKQDRQVLSRLVELFANVNANDNAYNGVALAA